MGGYQMTITKNFYKTFSDLACELMNQRQMSIYSSKFSKREFTRHQLLTLLLLKTYVGKGYRHFTQFLEISKIPEWLKLRKIPHYTTLQKFASRQMVSELEKFLFASAKLAKNNCQRMGIDATGMSLMHASKHYEKRIGQLVRKRNFMKCALMADLDNQLVYSVKMRVKTRNDNLDFVPLWNKVKKEPFKWFYMDRGYDSDLNHGLVFQEGKTSFGCLKNLHIPIWRTQGQYRKKAKRIRKHKKKNWRALIETINSVIKRMFDNVIHAKNLHTMKVEMYLKLVTYNLYRLISRNLLNVNFLYAVIRALFLELLCLRYREMSMQC